LNRENKKRKVDDSSFDEESIPEKETTTMNCGSCGRIMYIRKNTFGRYWCCNDKKCKFTVHFKEKNNLLGFCQCNGMLIEKVVNKETVIACKNCDFQRPFDEQDELMKIIPHCVRCSKIMELEENIYWRCSNYPKCSYRISRIKFMNNIKRKKNVYGNNNNEHDKRIENYKKKKNTKKSKLKIHKLMITMKLVMIIK